MAKPKHGDWLPGYTEARSGMGGTQGRMGWMWNKDAFGPGKGGWVQMGPNGPTGQVKKYATDTNLVAGTINTIGRVSKFGAKWLTPLGPTIRAIERRNQLKIGNESDSDKPVNKKTNKTPFVQRIKRADGSNASLSETFDTEEFHPFGDPSKKNYKPNLNQFKLTSNKKEEWKGSNVNPPREHWDKVKNPWFIGPDADKNWNEAKEILKINHEEWLRKNRRKK